MVERRFHTSKAGGPTPPVGTFAKVTQSGRVADLFSIFKGILNNQPVAGSIPVLGFLPS